MGCTNIICGKQSYDYVKQQKLLQKCLLQLSHLSKCYSHDFVTKCYKNLILNPDSSILKYDKKLEPKQVVPHTIIEKWKLILYGTNIDNTNYIDCIGFDKQVQEQRIASKTYRFSKRNPFQIRLQDLYFHESYRQIEKDSGRVYLVPQIKQQLFQKLLKKIANHFPQSGYSLGINYIVGYFLLVGMSEMDSFWMFIHLALNERYLGLGFFQNDLPLMKVIVEIFKNLLRRKNKELYIHIYKNLQVDDTSWILKWVTSFFLSTFPIQFCHYVLDYVFTFGILGLAIVSFGIVNFFQNLIFKCEESTDFILLFQRLLNFQYLSHSVPIGKFMSSIYDISLQQRDFDLLGQIGDNFYVQYFILYSQWKFKSNKQSRQKMDELLSEWYQQNIKKRQNFKKMARTFDGKFFESNQSHSKMDQSNTNLQVTKQQKMVENCTQQPHIAFQNLENFSIKIPQELRLSNLENAQTIKVSSRNRNKSQKSNSAQSEQVSSVQSFNFSFNQIQRQMKKLKSQKYFKKNVHNAQRQIKSEGQKMQNDKSSEVFKEKSQCLSMRSFSHLDRVSQDSITFNQKTLNQQIPKKLTLTQTLPMRNKNIQHGLQGMIEMRTLNSSENLIMFLNKLTQNIEGQKDSDIEQKSQKNQKQGNTIVAKRQSNSQLSDNHLQFFKSEINTLKQLQSLFQKTDEKLKIQDSDIKDIEDKSIQQKQIQQTLKEKQNQGNQQNQIQNVKSQSNLQNDPKNVENVQNAEKEQNENDKTVRISFSSVIVDQKIQHFN